MKKVSQEFDERSKKYDYIYNSKSSSLLHQEKRVRANIIEEYIEKNLIFKHEDLILDIGCGFGNILLNLRKRGIKAKMYGVDISKNMINLAKNNLHTLNFDKIKFVNGNIDIVSSKAKTVLSVGVLGYQENQEEFLQKLCSLVEQEGYLIFTSGNGDSFLRKTRQFLYKLYCFILKKKNRVKFNSIKDQQIDTIVKENYFHLEKKFYITFGLGLFPSSFECKIDNFIKKYLSTSKFGKYFSLTVIYILKRNN